MVGSVKLEQRFIADEKSTVYHRTGIKGFLYRHQPSSAYDTLRGARLRLAQSPLGAQLNQARAAVYDAAARSGVLSGLYYALGSRTYDREHKATLSARARYLRDVHTGDGNVFLLRRNIHKLEKALIMKPRRELFALAYLGETVTSYADCVARLLAGQLRDTDTLEWSRQVLTVYFGAVQKSHPLVDQARAGCSTPRSRATSQPATSSACRSRGTRSSCRRTTRSCSWRSTAARCAGSISGRCRARASIARWWSRACRRRRATASRSGSRSSTSRSCARGSRRSPRARRAGSTTSRASS